MNHPNINSQRYIIINIAGLSIKIHHITPYIPELCKDFLSINSRYDFEIAGTLEELEMERAISEHQSWPMGIYESTVLFRKICLKALSYQVFFLHSAVVAVDGKSYAFLANSGVGKSTHIQHWMKYSTEIGKTPVIINGDKTLYRIIGDKIHTCGHPWAGKEHWYANQMVPLKALCFLERGMKNSIRVCEINEAMGKIFHQVLLPKDKEQLIQTLDLIEYLLLSVPQYSLECTDSTEAAEIAYETMSRGVENFENQ